MCQSEHEGKQIKLPFRLKIEQPKQTSTLALLPTPPSLPLISAALSLSLTSHAYPVRKPLPPLLPTPSHYKAFESASAFAFASNKHIYKLQKEVSDGNKQSNVKPTLRTDSRRIFKTLMYVIM